MFDIFKELEEVLGHMQRIVNCFNCKKPVDKDRAVKVGHHYYCHHDGIEAVERLKDKQWE